MLKDNQTLNLRVTFSRLRLGDGSREGELIIEDEKSQKQFLKITFSPETFYQVFAEAMAAVQVKGVTDSLHLVGKKKVVDHISFPVPTGTLREKALEIAQQYCPEGWEIGDPMRSQSSFSNGQGHVSIVKYVDE